MDENLIERFKRQQAEKIEQNELNQAQFEYDRSANAFRMFEDSLKTFTDYITKNDYARATVRTVEGEDYLTYKLYSYGVYDNDLSYRGKPVSLALNGSGDVSFLHETLPNHSYYTSRSESGFSTPRPFKIARTLEEYREQLAEDKNSEDFYADGSLLQWSFWMHYEMYDSEHWKRTRSLLYPARSHEAYVREQLVQQYFPDGFTHDEYRRNRAR